ncbi:MAG: hypothetical protein QOI59_3825 [Gammaproteobacteria bacterium]|jgi:hypothetical protein|nr:hypothetical protein [Gammaproteobacteria bacterium]
MHLLMMITLCLASVCEATALAWKPASLVKFVPEVMAIIIACAVFFEGVRKGFPNVATRYWIAFGSMAFIVICGILTNSVGSGPVFGGIRVYVRAIPLFLVPAVFTFTDEQIKTQVKLMLGIGLLQVPVAIYQRYVIWAAGRFSGDDVRGTAADSGILSIILICMALVLLGAYMRKQITATRFFILFFLLLLPTMINETKATVILLPIGLLTTIVAGSPTGQRLKVFTMGVVLLGVFGAILVPVYDWMAEKNPYKNEKHLMDFFTNSQEMNRYMETKGGAGVGTQHAVRRNDAIRVPIQYLSKDPVKLAFGLGIGNASHSNLGQNFEGDYYDLFQYFSVLSISTFMLELGMFGTVVVFILYALLFFDAIAVAREDTGLRGSLAIGWIGIVPVIVAAMFYTSIHLFTILSFYFWYFGGMVAARRTQLAAVHTMEAATAVRRRMA